jgi:hypothetical protein
MLANYWQGCFPFENSLLKPPATPVELSLDSPPETPLEIQLRRSSIPQTTVGSCSPSTAWTNSAGVA